MKTATKKIVCILLDGILVPFSIIFLPLLKLMRRLGIEHFSLHRKMFLSIGVFPIRDHYYEPQLKYSAEFDAKKKRELPLDFDIPRQLIALQNLQHKEELKELQSNHAEGGNDFYVNNPNFGAGDAELYYLMIRNTKPKKIIEIGSGFSTLLALEAIHKNKTEGFVTELTCIDPYEEAWLANHSEINLVRQRVETLDPVLFRTLQANDILFIDSSHIIRPENDVLFEYMQLLPALNPGVIIHIHDIFSPRHYRQDWLTRLYRFWNEQYLLEAFLYNNKAFQILYSLNYLKNDFYDATKEALIHLAPADEPSSFWLKKLNE